MGPAKRRREPAALFQESESEEEGKADDLAELRINEEYARRFEVRLHTLQKPTPAARHMCTRQTQLTWMYSTTSAELSCTACKPSIQNWLRELRDRQEGKTTKRALLLRPKRRCGMQKRVPVV